MKGVTSYKGVAGFYFRFLLYQLVSAGKLDQGNKTILDFGCGYGELKRYLPGVNVVGYDIIPALSDVADWRTVAFDVFVANEVFYTFTSDDLNALLLELKSRSSAPVLVIGISRQGLLNKIGKHLFGRPDAHAGTRINPRQEREILQRHCTVIRRKGVLFLADVYVLQFRKD